MTYKIINGTLPDADEVMNNINDMFTQIGLNTIRSLINRAGVWSSGEIDGWGEAYVSAAGREGSVDTEETSANFDTNKYKAFDTTYPFVIVEATSLTESDFAINDCTIDKFATGKWILQCTTGTVAVRRAQIYKTLFYGSNGSDPRSTSTYITGLTALKTSDADDVGKRAHYAETSTNAIGETIEYTGTFADTTTNTDCSIWGFVACGGTSGNASGSVELPNGTSVIGRATDGTSDETGTDTESDEQDNPATVVLNGEGGSSASSTTRAIILCSGDITWSASEAGTPTYSNTDFNTSESVPDFTAATSSDYDSIITHNIPSGTFNSTISSSFGTSLVDDWETGANIQYKLTNATEDTGWLETEEVTNFTAFTSEPTTLIVKLVPKATSPTTGYPSIKGFWVRAS
jgi:hypothetical protein